MDQSIEFDGPFVVSRDDIPVLRRSLVPPFEVRPFTSHPMLKAAASSEVTLAWVHAPAGKEVELVSHPHASLLIVLRGTADLVGEQRRGIEPGDVVTLPASQEYGFANVESGFHALHVTFCPPDSDGAETEALTLEHLLAENEVRARMALESPFFVLLRNGGLDTPGKRAIARDAIRVFSDAFQALLFTRQAMCRDESYLSTFHTHLLEELDHNSLLQASKDSRASLDPVLRATTSWFCRQMLYLDNAGKAVVTLALETGGYHFHTLAQPVFAADDSARYFDVHAEGDEIHKDMGVDALRGLHPDTYRNLLQLLDDSWDMIEAATGRFADLIELEGMKS